MTTDQNASPELRHTIRTVSLGALLRTIRYPFIFLSLWIIPPLMGRQSYDTYVLFISVFVILDQFTDAGIGHVFGRFVPEYESRGDRAATSRLLHGVLFYGQVLALSMIVACCIVAAARPLPGFPRHRLIALGVLLVLTRLEGTLFGFLYGLNRIAQFSTKEAARSGLTFLLVFGGYVWLGLDGAFWGLVLNEAVLCIVSLYWTRSYLFRRPAGVTVRFLWPYIVFGVQFYIPSFLFTFLRRSGTIFLKAMDSAEGEISDFSIANQVLLLMVLFLGMIVSTLLPSLAALHINDRKESIHKYQRVVLNYCAAIVFLAFNGLLWVGDMVIRRWDQSFSAVYDNARIIFPAAIPAMVAYVCMNYALLHKRCRGYTYSVAAGLGVMVAACILLIPHFGAVGASWATLAGYIALASSSAIAYRAEIGPALRTLWLVLLPGVVLSPLYLLRPGPAGSVAMFVLTSCAYVISLWALRIVRIRELRNMTAAFRRPQDT